MIVCPSCLHQNPAGAAHCEACYTVLPTVTHCPYCGASVQVDASFCGQCGSSLKKSPLHQPPAGVDIGVDIQVSVPEKSATLSEVMSLGNYANDELCLSALLDPTSGLPSDWQAKATLSQVALPPVAFAPEPSSHLSGPVAKPLIHAGDYTQLQVQQGRLLHLQSNTAIELPQSLQVIHLGKPNERIPPDIDVAGFPHSEVVSRIHADIRIEGDSFFIEDTGSANGTYINNLPLLPGNRHRLRVGDRIALGKGDLVTFLFQMN